MNNVKGISERLDCMINKQLAYCGAMYYSLWEDNPMVSLTRGTVVGLEYGKANFGWSSECRKMEKAAVLDINNCNVMGFWDSCRGGEPWLSGSPS